MKKNFTILAASILAYLVITFANGAIVYGK